MACAWIRTPNGSLWSLNGGTATLTRDTVAETFYRSWATHGALWMPTPTAVPKCSGGTTIESPYDAAAEAAAIKAGAPYRWVDDCNQYIRIPGTSTRFWIPNNPPVQGRALSTDTDLIGCGNGVVLPGGAR